MKTNRTFKVGDRAYITVYDEAAKLVEVEGVVHKVVNTPDFQGGYIEIADKEGELIAWGSASTMDPRHQPRTKRD